MSFLALLQGGVFAAAVPADVGPVLIEDLGPCGHVAAGTEVPPCGAAIRPGARSNLCTLNFVVTDGERLYIGAAGHCAPMGARLRVAGLPGELGTVVFRQATSSADWAFVRIDPEDETWVDPTLCRFGGPVAGPLGAVRAPVPGEAVVHYGHGQGLGEDEATRGRAGAVVLPSSPVAYDFMFTGAVGPGDSGSPVRAASGEALGIAVAVLTVSVGPFGVGDLPGEVFATRFDRALAAFEAELGKGLVVVPGDLVPSV